MLQYLWMIQIVKSFIVTKSVLYLCVVDEYNFKGFPWKYILSQKYWLGYNCAWALILLIKIQFFTDKIYHSAAEENHRHGIFSDNSNFINKHNNDGSHSYTLEMNHLGDLTPEEFKHMLNGHIPSQNKMVDILD